MITTIKNYLFLHFVLILYSFAALFSKRAAGYDFLSIPFLANYGIVLIILLFYAILWQQVLKRFSLSTAFSNKSVVILWGMLWGILFFGEGINFFMLAGALLIIVGIYFVGKDEHESN